MARREYTPEELGLPAKREFTPEELGLVSPKADERPSGGLAALKQSASRLLADSVLGGTNYFLDDDTVRKAAKADRERTGKMANLTEWEDVKKQFANEGALGGLGSLGNFAKEQLFSQVPIMGTVAAGGALGAKLGAMTANPVGILAGTAIGGALATLPSFIGGNISRQAEEQEKSGAQQPLDRTAATLGAAAQAGTESLGTLFLLGRLGVSKSALQSFLNKPIEQVEAELVKKSQQSLIGAATKGALKGTAEVPVEVAQSVIERAQAGLSLLTPDALKEYEASAASALITGSPVKAATDVYERGASRGELEELQQNRAGQERAKQAAAETAQRATPEYKLEIANERITLIEENRALAEVLKDKTLDKETRKEAYEKVKENGKRIREINGELTPSASLDTLVQREQAKRGAGLTDEFGNRVEAPGNRNLVVDEFGNVVGDGPTSEEEQRRAIAGKRQADTTIAGLRQSEADAEQAELDRRASTNRYDRENGSAEFDGAEDAAASLSRIKATQDERAATLAAEREAQERRTQERLSAQRNKAATGYLESLDQAEDAADQDAFSELKAIAQQREEQRNTERAAGELEQTLKDSPLGNVLFGDGRELSEPEREKVVSTLRAGTIDRLGGSVLGLNLGGKQVSLVDPEERLASIEATLADLDQRKSAAPQGLSPTTIKGENPDAPRGAFSGMTLEQLDETIRKEGEAVKRIEDLIKQGRLNGEKTGPVVQRLQDKLEQLENARRDLLDTSELDAQRQEVMAERERVKRSQGRFDYAAVENTLKAINARIEALENAKRSNTLTEDAQLTNADGSLTDVGKQAAATESVLQELMQLRDMAQRTLDRRNAESGANATLDAASAQERFDAELQGPTITEDVAQKRAQETLRRESEQRLTALRTRLAAMEDQLAGLEGRDPARRYEVQKAIERLRSRVEDVKQGRTLSDAQNNTFNEVTRYVGDIWHGNHLGAGVRGRAKDQDSAGTLRPTIEGKAEEAKRKLIAQTLDRVRTYRVATGRRPLTQQQEIALGLQVRQALDELQTNNKEDVARVKGYLADLQTRYSSEIGTAQKTGSKRTRFESPFSLVRQTPSVNEQRDRREGKDSPNLLKAREYVSRKLRAVLDAGGLDAQATRILERAQDALDNDITSRETTALINQQVERLRKGMEPAFLREIEDQLNLESEAQSGSVMGWQEQQGDLLTPTDAEMERQATASPEDIASGKAGPTPSATARATPGMFQRLLGSKLIQTLREKVARLRQAMDAERTRAGDEARVRQKIANLQQSLALISDNKVTAPLPLPVQSVASFTRETNDYIKRNKAALDNLERRISNGDYNDLGDALAARERIKNTIARMEVERAQYADTYRAVVEHNARAAKLRGDEALQQSIIADIKQEIALLKQQLPTEQRAERQADLKQAEDRFAQALLDGNKRQINALKQRIAEIERDLAEMPAPAVPSAAEQPGTPKQRAKRTELATRQKELEAAQAEERALREAVQRQKAELTAHLQRLREGATIRTITSVETNVAVKVSRKAVETLRTELAAEQQKPREERNEALISELAQQIAAKDTREQRERSAKEVERLQNDIEAERAKANPSQENILALQSELLAEQRNLAQLSERFREQRSERVKRVVTTTETPADRQNDKTEDENERSSRNIEQARKTFVRTSERIDVLKPALAAAESRVKKKYGSLAKYAQELNDLRAKRKELGEVRDGFSAGERRGDVQIEYSRLSDKIDAMAREYDAAAQEYEKVRASHDAARNFLLKQQDRIQKQIDAERAKKNPSARVISVLETERGEYALPALKREMLPAQRKALESEQKKQAQAISTVARLGDRPERSAPKKSLRTGDSEGRREDIEGGTDAEDAAGQYASKIREGLAAFKRDGEDPNATAFREVEGKQGPDRVDLDKADKVIERIKKKLPPNVKFIYARTVADAPVKFHAAMARRGTDPNGALGAVLPDGTVVVIGENHASLNDLEETVAHELIGHYGVDVILGNEGMLDLVNRLYARGDDFVMEVARDLGVVEDVEAAKAAADRIPGLSEQQRRVMVVRELIAHAAEGRRVAPSAVQRVKDFVKMVVDALKRFFTGAGMDTMAARSTREIHELIKQAEKALQSGSLGQYRTIDGQPAFRTSKARYGGLSAESIGTIDNVVAGPTSARDKLRAHASGFYQRAFDARAPLESISNAMDDRVAATQMMYDIRMADQSLNWVSEIASSGPATLVKKTDAKTGADYWMIEAQKGASLAGVVKSLSKLTKQGFNAEGINQLFTTYMAALRVKSGVPITQLNYKATVSEAQLNALIKDVESNPQVKQVLDDARAQYNDYNKGLIEFAVQTGAISKQEGARLKSKQDYIPYYRVQNNMVQLVIGGERPIDVGNLADQPELKPLLGSDEKIVDFFTSSLQNTTLLTNKALRNLATRNVAVTLAKMGLAKVNKPSKNGASPQGPNVIRFQLDGEPRYAIIETEGTAFENIPPELIVKGLTGMSLVIPAGVKMLGAPTMLLRKTVTLNPLYPYRQLFKDAISMGMTSGANLNPITSVLKSAQQYGKSTWSKNPTEDLLQRRGIVGGRSLTGTTEDMKQIMRRVAAGGDGMLYSLIAKQEAAAIRADAATRAMLYNEFIAKGMNEMEATLAALEAMNFTKRGLSPTIFYFNQLMPFFNAGMQSINVLYRAMFNKGSINKQLDTRAAIVKGGLLLAGMTLAYASAVSDEEWYENTPEEVKLGNFLIKLPGLDEPLKVPIPYEIGLIFKAIPEALMNLGKKDADSGRTVQALASLAGNSIPFSIPTAMKAPIEIATNTDFFTGGDIETRRDRTLDPQERARPNTTEVSKFGAGLVNGIAREFGSSGIVSPVQIDHLVKGYTTGLGIALMSALNPLLRDESGPSRPEPRVNELPIIGGMFQPLDGGAIIDQMYEFMEKANRAEQTFKKLMEDGRIAEAERYLEDFRDKIVYGKVADKFTKEMGEITKYERAIRSSRDMTPVEKRSQLDDMRKLKIDYARSMRDAIRATTSP